MEYILSTVCSGIGSPEFAAEELSAETPFKPKQGFYCEINKFARASYEAMFGKGLFVEDMTKAEWEGPEYYSDVFIGGIPCQAFSLAGLRKGELDPRGLLFYDFYRYVKKQQPKAFIIENVKGLLSDSGGKTFQNWMLMLGDSVNGHMQMFNHELSLGYNLHWTVLNTKDFGIPQNRERVFLVGIRPDLPNTFRFPVGFQLKLRLKYILEPVVDEKYYLSDKMINCLVNHSDNMKSNGNGFKTSFLDVNTVNTVNTVKSNYGKMPGDADYISEPVLVSRERRTAEAKAERRQTGSNSFRGKELVFEPSEVMNCIQTSLTNDNIIVMANTNSKHEHNSRIYSPAGVSPAGVSPAVLFTNGGGAEPPKIITSRLSHFKESENAIRGIKSDGSGLQEHFYNKETGTAGTVSSSHKPKVIVSEIPELIIDGNVYGNGQAGKIYNESGICPTVSGQRVNSQGFLNTNYRIRRLTPLECWRLQGFSDEAFYKAKAVNSDSQLYKQAGNSMTTKVIKGMLKNILNCIFTPSP